MILTENTIKAYAKINLHLEILNKREDGYHNILSVMAKTKLFDLLKLEKINLYDKETIETKISIKNTGGIFKEEIDKIPEKENLITKATLYYLDKINKSAEIEFSIKKNIPTGAGLGGGSSDAASALKILNKNIMGLNEDELFHIGKKVGADVPYCLINKPAICEGIGEIISPLNAKLNYNILIVNNGLHINTGNAYNILNRPANLDFDTKQFDNKKEKLTNIITNFHYSDELKYLTNDFEKVIFKKYPELDQLKKTIAKFEPDFSIMTGSGSTIISLFEDYQKAIFAKNKLEKKTKLVLLTKFL